MNSRLERENWFLPKITLKAQQRPPKEEVHSFQRPMAINEEPMNGRTLSNLKVHQIKVSNPVWNCLAMVCGVGWVLCICSRFFQFNWTCNSTAFLKGATHKWYLIFRKGGGLYLPKLEIIGYRAVIYLFIQITILSRRFWKSFPGQFLLPWKSGYKFFQK